MRTEDVLLKLIDAAERAVTLRAAGPDDPDALGAMVDAITCPVGVVLSGAHPMLMDAMTAARTSGDERWLMIAGALIPMVRSDLAACHAARRQKLDDDPTESYRRTGGGMPTHERRSYGRG